MFVCLDIAGGLVVRRVQHRNTVFFPTTHVKHSHTCDDTSVCLREDAAKARLHSCFRASRACLYTKQQCELRQKRYKSFTVPTRECSCWGKKWKQQKLFGSTSGHIEPGSALDGRLQGGTTSCSLFPVGLTARSHELTGIPYFYYFLPRMTRTRAPVPLHLWDLPLIQSHYMTSHAHVQQRKQALSQSAARKGGVVALPCHQWTLTYLASVSAQWPSSVLQLSCWPHSGRVKASSKNVFKGLYPRFQTVYLNQYHFYLPNVYFFVQASRATVNFDEKSLRQLGLK